MNISKRNLERVALHEWYETPRRISEIDFLPLHRSVRAAERYSPIRVGAVEVSFVWVSCALHLTLCGQSDLNHTLQDYC